MATYLLIENKGVFGTELLSIVGASTSRGEADMIGQFGSGTKYAFAQCLRSQNEVIYTSGTDVFKFAVDEHETTDIKGDVRTIKEVVMCQVGGSKRRKKALNFEVSFGALEWTHISMALREFVSNACDGSMKLQGDYKGVRIELVEDAGKFARQGYTRVWVQADAEVKRYYQDLHRNFLMLGKDGFDAKTTLIPKEMPDRLRVYRKGVMVGQFEERSLFDYNLNNVNLRESRVLDEYSAKYHIAEAVKKADAKHIAKIIRAMTEHKDVYEVTKMDHHSLKCQTWDTYHDNKIKETWQEAFKEVVGNQIACSSIHHAEMVEMKGYDPILIPDVLDGVFKSYDIKGTAVDVLDHFTVNGREKADLSEPLKQAAIKLWTDLQNLGLTKDKPMPPVEGYRDVMNAGGTTLGYYDPIGKIIGINSDCFDSPFNFTKTLLEEFAHYITEAADCSRDLQDWAFRAATLAFMDI